MNRGVVAFFIILVIAVAVTYVETGFKFLGKSTTTITATTSTPTTTILTTSTTTINLSNYLIPCDGFILFSNQTNSVLTGNCIWNGGLLGVWVAAGDAGYESALIRGVDNRTYINQSSPYGCLAFFTNFTAPAQIYTVTLKTGPGNGSCGYTMVKINTTTTPPPVLYYKYVYNGDFADGKYTGWTVTNAGFGAAPLNLSYANSQSCYQSSPWNNYNGTFFATNYNCGTTNAPGNLTSTKFLVQAATPFLNFKIISQSDNFLYIEILKNNTPIIVVHYNTFNQSLSGDPASTFRNASIPLSLLVNKVVQVRVVARTTKPQTYIAVGDFAVEGRPVQDLGIVSNETFNTS